MRLKLTPEFRKLKPIITREKALSAFRLVLALGLSGLFSLSTLADTRLTPNWMVNNLGVLVQPGSSYLESFNAGNAYIMRDAMMDAQDVPGMRQTVYALQRSYESRKQQGLMDAAAQRDYLEKLQVVRDQLVTKVSQKELQKHERKISRLLENTPSGIRAMAGVAGAFAMFYSNRPVRLHVIQGADLVARTSLPLKTGQIELYTPLVHSGVYVAMGAPSSFREATPAVGEERFRFSMWRNLPVLNMSSGISYGTTSTLLTASLQQPLGERLRCVFDSSHALDSQFLVVRQPEDSIRFEYSIEF